MEDNFNTPILFLIFNRPDLAQRVFAKIAKVKPRQLFIAADGPRENTPGDKEKCATSREIVNNIDWDCEIKTLFRGRNLGCRKAASSAIDWFFENVEEGIILEDDCLPHYTFFKFCEELLAKYRNNNLIGGICGDNFVEVNRTSYSYSFSRYNLIWGWATWRRAWKYYDLNIKLWPEIKETGWLYDILQNKRAVSFWTKNLEDVYQGKLNTWDFPWFFACWTNSFLTIYPKVNLVTNIGFDKNATHTKKYNPFANFEMHPMDFPLLHPAYIIRDSMADRLIEKEYFSIISILGRVVRKIRRIFKKYKKYFKLF